MKVVSVSNQKGGVGKTTSVINIASRLSELKYRTLIIDLDPQANASGCFSKHYNPGKHLGAYDVLLGACELDDAIVTLEESLFLVPASRDLAGAELELVAAFDRESQLRNAIEAMSSCFDYVIIDTPPTLGLLTVNALTASDSVLIPMQSEYYALEGLTQLLNIVKLIRKRLNRHLQLEGVFLTMFDGRNNLSKQVEEELKNHFGGLLFATRVPRNIKLSEAPSHGRSIFGYDRKSKGAMAYQGLVSEFLERQAILPSNGFAAEIDGGQGVHV
tara:strand:- start:93 stop:911 length:819 start_codon:yes stop_codon:yes gene_type:complete